MRISFFTFFLITVFSFIQAEDYEPYYEDKNFSVSNNEDFLFFQNNATLLSSSEDFRMMYLHHTQRNGLSFYQNSSNSVNQSILCILYKSKCFYIDINRTSYLNFSLIATSPNPIIYTKYVNFADEIATAIIYYDGYIFKIKSFDVDSISESNDIGNAALAIEKKEIYLNGNKFIFMYNTNFLAEKYNYININSKIFNYSGYDHDNYKYYATVTEDNIRLRTNGTLKSNVIRLLKKDELIKIIMIDPTQIKIENESGFWVLVCTGESDFGWIWSKYISGFHEY